jgi:hypothetical protein
VLYILDKDREAGLTSGCHRRSIPFPEAVRGPLEVVGVSLGELAPDSFRFVLLALKHPKLSPPVVENRFKTYFFATDARERK